MDSNERYWLSRRDCELLRIIASVMVVVVHCVHVWTDYFFATHDFASVGFAATLIDQAARFTVPLFFFLSGFGLTCQFMEREPGLLDYYRSRPVKILIPFLMWSAITSFRHFDVLFYDLPWHASPILSFLHFLKFLFADGFDYQYYFLIVIFQFYLLFPFLYKLVRNRWALVGFFLLQMAFMSPVEGYLELMGWQLPSLHSSLLLFYVFYCVAGIYAALHRDFLARILRNVSSPQVLVFWLGAWSLTIAEYWVNINHGKTVWETDHFNRWSVAVYCTACLMLFLKHKERIQTFLQLRPNWNFLYSGVAPYTFFVYLVHTHVLRLVELLCNEISAWDLASRILWVVCGSYAVAWLAQWLLADFPRLRFALGLPKPNWKPEDLPGYSWLRTRFNPRSPS